MSNDDPQRRRRWIFWLASGLTMPIVCICGSVYDAPGDLRFVGRWRSTGLAAPFYDAILEPDGRGRVHLKQAGGSPMWLKTAWHADAKELRMELNDGDRQEPLVLDVYDVQPNRLKLMEVTYRELRDPLRDLNAYTERFVLSRIP